MRWKWKCRTISGALNVGKHCRAGEVLKKSTRRSYGKTYAQASNAVDKNACTACYVSLFVIALHMVFGGGGAGPRHVSGGVGCGDAGG